MHGLRCLENVVPPGLLGGLGATYSSGGVGGSFILSLIPFGLPPWESCCSISPGGRELCSCQLWDRRYLTLWEALRYKEILSRKFCADLNWLGKFILGSAL